MQRIPHQFGRRLVKAAFQWHENITFVLTIQGRMDKKPKTLSGNNSVVECDLAKVEVAGSNPVSRSIFLGGIAKW